MDTTAKIAACNICLLATNMKACNLCAFKVGLTVEATAKENETDKWLDTLDNDQLAFVQWVTS